jgi:excisionase family DNA binding protein
MEAAAANAGNRPQGGFRERRFLTAGRVAERLGVNTATVYRAVQRGEVPAVQLGGPRHTIRIPEDEFMEWLFSDGEGAA